MKLRIFLFYVYLLEIYIRNSFSKVCFDVDKLTNTDDSFELQFLRFCIDRFDHAQGHGDPNRC